jgi:hypothetical protein
MRRAHNLFLPPSTMSVAEDKLVEDTAAAEAAARKKQQLKLIRLHSFLNAFVSMLNYSTRTEILRDLCGGKHRAHLRSVRAVDDPPHYHTPAASISCAQVISPRLPRT